MANQNNFFNLYLKVNDKEAEKTLNSVGKDLRTLRSYTRNLEEGTEKWHKANEKLAEVEKTYDEMKAKQRDLINETKKSIATTEGQISAMDEFGASFHQAFEGARNGDLIGFREGMNGVKSGIMGATRAAWAFIATPVGAALATLAAVAGSAKLLWDYNAALEETNKQLRSLGVSAEEMDTVRSEVEAVAETYDKEFSEIAKNAKSLSVSFGISMSEAIDVISRGLADGGKMNSEFMDSLGEYDEFFAQAGYSAQQFVDVINQGVELGIYSDKLPDAIKEAGLSLREQTESTREALTNAFGATFSKDLLSKIDKGEITVREGLEAIAEQAEKTGLTQQQQAQLTADIFKGAGEDAGGAMKVLEAVSKSAQRELSDTARAELELTEANEKLNKVQSELFGIAGFGELWVKIKTVSVNAITGVLTYLQNLKNMGEVVATEITNFFIGMANTTLTTVQQMVTTMSPALKALGMDVQGIQRSLESMKMNEVNFVSKVTPPSGVDTPDDDDPAPDLAAQEAARKAREEAEKRAEEAEKNRQQREKDALAAQKKAQQEKENNEKSLTDFLQSERDKRRINQLQGLDKELALIDQKYAEKLQKAADNEDLLRELELQKQQEKDDAIASKKKEQLDRLNEIEKENEALKNDAEFEKELANLETQQEKDELRLQRARDLALQELEIEKNAELQKLEAVEGSEKLKAAIRENYRLQEEKMKGEFAKQEQKLKSDQVSWTELTEKQKLNAITGALGAAADAFNEGSGAWKAIKVSETLITTYQSAQNAYNALAGIPVVGPALGAAAAAVAVSSGLQQVSKIKGTSIQKMNKPNNSFARGGYTDVFGLGYKDESGHEVAGVVHTDEYVVPKIVRQDPEVPPILNYLEKKRKKALNLYADGGDTSTRQANPSFTSTSSDPEIKNLLIRMMEKMEEPWVVENYFGYEAEERRKEMEEKLKKIKDRSKIKPE